MWFHDLSRIALIGIGATAVMDAWLLLLRHLGVRTLDMALLGRWSGHLARGKIAHSRIADSAPVRGERVLGWLVHYATGVAFAALLVVIAGVEWMRLPTLVSAALFGASTVVAPLLVLQPAMGAGFAASRTPTPIRNCLRSLGSHTAFGIGLFVAAVATSRVIS